MRLLLNFVTFASVLGSVDRPHHGHEDGSLNPVNVNGLCLRLVRGWTLFSSAFCVLHVYNSKKISTHPMVHPHTQRFVTALAPWSTPSPEHPPVDHLWAPVAELGVCTPQVAMLFCCTRISKQQKKYIYKTKKNKSNQGLPNAYGMPA